MTAPPVHYQGRAEGHSGCMRPRPPVPAGRLTRDRAAVTCRKCWTTLWYRTDRANPPARLTYRKWPPR